MYMVHEIHRRQQIEQFSGGILKRSRLAGEKENGGTGGLQICCRRNRTGACHAKYFFFQRISPKGDKRVFWRDDKPQNSCNLSEQHFRHLFDNQLNQLFPNSEAAMLSKYVKLFQVNSSHFHFQLLVGVFGVVGNTSGIIWFSRKLIQKNFHQLMLRFQIKMFHQKSPNKKQQKRIPMKKSPRKNDVQPGPL